jgi:hypothetical protein
MNYVDPRHVNSPQDYVTDVRVVHDGGGDDPAKSFSVARIKWEGADCVAIRWNVAMREFDDPAKQQGKQCVGVPSSRGYPVWFILPDEITDITSEIWKKIASIKEKNKNGH